ncbi:UNKNOWN [Stylonychia lemnae]|uniref:Uncharacterized protein n=1 Tax=Stylonychia lemnae TaxID=5949 RepID=A0A078AXG2_STYLE|nr:UNKNOWN [Stylonychia lemnae]|eukprot:CDW85473.1 UNKNOWN [Stylonychia lemnae]
MIQIIENLQEQLREKDKLDKSVVNDYKVKSENLQKQLDAVNDQLEKVKLERDNSKDQNKKLVELFNKLEKKLNDKVTREEQLEEECLSLKESLQMMTVQVEKIEEGLERKVRDKDKQVKKLLQKIDMLEREKRMKEDMEEMEDLMNENSVLQDKTYQSLNDSQKIYDSSKSSSKKIKK